MANDVNVVGEYNIKTPVGATFQRQLTWSDSGTPINLTGYSARFTVKRDPADSQTVIALTDASVNPAGTIVLGGAAGTITITVPGATMAALDVQEYVYDLEMEDGSGFITRLVEGRFEATAGVTS